MENALDIGRLEKMVTASEEVTETNRRKAERDRDYFDGKQLTKEELAALKKRGQPPVVFNGVRKKIEWLEGLQIKQRTDPKAYPRTPEHGEAADAATDAIRFVCDNTNWDVTCSAVYSEMLVEGFSGVEVIHRQTRKGDVEVEILHVPWDRLFYDPHSRKADFSDARYKGTIIWSDLDDVLLDHPEAKKDLEGMLAEYAGQDTYDDRPKSTYWCDAARRRIKVCLIWYRVKTEWHWCKFVNQTKLGSGVSPYKDEEGDTVCPLIMRSAYVDRDNNRYGVVRDMIDPQDEVNKRRSKALHNFVTRQIVMSKGVGQAADLRRQMARADGILEIDATKDDIFEIQSNADLAQGQVMLYQDAKAELDDTGVSEALTGDQGSSQSGRAILAKQQSGMVGVTRLTDNLGQFTREVYEATWLRIRQFWDAERWIRVTDDEDNARFVGLNRQVTLQEYLSQLPQEEVAQIAYQYGLRPGDPRLSQPVGIENNVAEMDVDILIEEAPDRITLAGETFEALLKYAQAGTLPPEVLLKADPSLPSKKRDELLNALAESQKQQAQTQGPMIEAELQKTQSETAKNMAQAQGQVTAAGF